MSTIYNGVPTNVSNSNSQTISAVGGTSPAPFLVTTASSHGFQTNDTVAISGTSVCDGNWTVTVTGLTTFTLNGSTASGTASSGTAVDISLAPAITIPSDGDAFTVSSVNTALQALIDRTQFLNKNAAVFTASGTFVVPTGVTNMWTYMFGGGGGGGAGSQGPSAASTQSLGGAGGAGSVALYQPFSVSPGNTITVTVGAGGTGGAPAGPADGSDGAYSSLGIGVSTVVYAAGGAGGPGGSHVVAASGTDYVWLPGGNGPAHPHAYNAAAVTSTTSSVPVLPLNYGCGGAAVANDTGTPAQSFNGFSSIDGWIGGSGATGGTAHTTSFGGGGGGGGGAGPVGEQLFGTSGGAGGVGGSGASGFGSPGATGGSAGANTGGGGGGGGGGGCASASGATGGNGGSGLVILYY